MGDLADMARREAHRAQARRNCELFTGHIWEEGDPKRMPDGIEYATQVCLLCGATRLLNRPPLQPGERCTDRSHQTCNHD